MTEHVILLHGIGMNPFSMTFFETALKKEGYTTHNLDYPSTTKSIEDIADVIDGEIRLRIPDSQAPKHFVGHSMGGLITMATLNIGKLKNVKRVVALGTPFKGSPVADFMSDTNVLKDFYNPFFGPAGRQLRTDYRTTHTLPLPKGVELGCIAGTQSWQHFLFQPIMKDHAPSDGVVTVESAIHENAKDSIQLNCTHETFLAMQGPEQALNFLKKGVFNHP